jgi:hypothetical protein
MTSTQKPKSLVDLVTENHGVGGSIPPLAPSIPDQRQLVTIDGSVGLEWRVFSWVPIWVTIAKF